MMSVAERLEKSMGIQLDETDRTAILEAQTQTALPAQQEPSVVVEGLPSLPSEAADEGYIDNILTRLGAAGYGVASNALLGADDELVGAAGTTINAMSDTASALYNLDPSLLPSMDSIQQDYYDSKQTYNTNKDRAYENNPGSYLAGSVLGLAVPGSAYRKAGTTLGKMAVGTALGTTNEIMSSNAPTTEAIGNAIGDVPVNAAVMGALMGPAGALSRFVPASTTSISNLIKNPSVKTAASALVAPAINTAIKIPAKVSSGLGKLYPLLQMRESEVKPSTSLMQKVQSAELSPTSPELLKSPKQQEAEAAGWQLNSFSPEEAEELKNILNQGIQSYNPSTEVIGDVADRQMLVNEIMNNDNLGSEEKAVRCERVMKKGKCRPDDLPEEWYVSRAGAMDVQGPASVSAIPTGAMPQSSVPMSQAPKGSMQSQYTNPGMYENKFASLQKRVQYRPQTG